MAKSDADTIVAIATAPGRGGVGVVRVSGKRSESIAQQMLGSVPPIRHASLHQFRDREHRIIDSGIALFFKAPASFTGEDVLELHGHGGPVVLDLILKRVLELGARLAEPGEFSRRAFLNDKIDLVQAEAIADLITAESTQSARAAVRSMQGDFSNRLRQLSEAVLNARMHVEAAIDFPDEELDLMQDALLKERLQIAINLCREIQDQAACGSALREGLNVVIAGKPNAGKSSILNCLAGYEAAIVTEVPGTTRDVLRERIWIDGMPVHIMDTAGLRETRDQVEAEGIKRAHAEIQKADHILYVVDATDYNQEEVAIELKRLPPEITRTILLNKSDLMQRPAEPSEERIVISAKTRFGIEQLRKHLKQIAGFSNTESGIFLARRRHLDALNRAATHLHQAHTNLMTRQAGELCAEELRLAHHHLGAITGEISSDDLLGHIFTSFCIGK